MSDLYDTPKFSYQQRKFLVEEIFLLLASFARILLEVLSLAMMIRVLLPIFFNPDGNRIYELTVVLTEPVVAPVRALLAKLNIGQNSPIDWGFFTAYLLLSILQTVLPAF